MSEPVLYLDPSSPYAYLAAERVEDVLGRPVHFETVVLGAIFQVRGSGSWAHTDLRAGNMADVERRAAAYGLPPITWPGGWPANSLHASRLVVWADEHGRGREALLALLRAGFAEGRDIADHAVLADVAAALGLPGELEAAIGRPEIKDELKRRTTAAIDLGVRGVPTLRIGDDLIYGDDRLEEARTPVRGESEELGAA